MDINDFARCTLTHVGECSQLVAIHLKHLAARSGVEPHLRFVLVILEIGGDKGDKLCLVGSQRQDKLTLVKCIKVALVGGVGKCRTYHAGEDGGCLHVVHTINHTVFTNHTVIHVRGVYFDICTVLGLHQPLSNLLGENNPAAVGKRLHDEIAHHQRVKLINAAITSGIGPVVGEELGDSLVGWRKDAISLALQHVHRLVVIHWPLTCDVRQLAVGQHIHLVTHIIGCLVVSLAKLGIFVIYADVVAVVAVVLECLVDCFQRTHHLVHTIKVAIVGDSGLCINNRSI